ncbi:MAG TPA: hypothetical protein VJU61_00845, partial [Polyangiaceae bacterium]|nr:hypothetical protein [Polyangiaceae bacterium]
GAITLDVANIQREIPGQTGYYDYRDTKRWWISYQDCLNNENFVFPLNLTNTTSPLEVWVGSDDCVASRGRDDHGQCWLVQNVPSPDDPTTVRVSVRNVVNHDLDANSVPGPLGRDVCDGSDDLNGEAVTFYFMLVEGGKATGSQSWNPTSVGGTGYDMVGPEPPGNITIGVGESQLSIGLEDLKEDTTRDGFEAFCVPEGTLADPGDFIPDADAGAGVDAGTGSGSGSGSDDGSAAPLACFTDVPRGGLRPPEDPAYRCGSASTTAQVLKTTSLQNDVAYAVGVAARDDIGNVGDLSDIECGTPTYMDDFFEIYTRSGGAVGGSGLCAMATGPLRFSPAGALLGGLALLALAVRRQRRAA